MSLDGKVHLIWGIVSLVALGLLLAVQPRDARLWLLLIVAIGSAALSIYTWRASH